MKRRKAVPQSQALTQIAVIEGMRDHQLPFWLIWRELKATTPKREWPALYLNGEGKPLRVREHLFADEKNGYDMDEAGAIDFVLYAYRNRKQYPDEWKMVWKAIRPFMSSAIDAMGKQ